MLRLLAVLALFFTLALAACGDDDSGLPSASPPATVAPTASPLNAGDAVYISLGDATQEGWGEDFAAHLSERLNRDFELAAFTGDVTTTELIAGVGGRKPSLLDQAVAAINDYESRGAVVVAVTLSVGSKDIADLSASCSDCAVEAAALAQRYREQLGVIYARLVQALDTPAPILQATALDASDCVQPEARAVIDAAPMNGIIAEITADNDAFVVNIAAVLSPGCTPDGLPISGGSVAIGEAHQAAYNTLPSGRVEPFIAP